MKTKSKTSLAARILGLIFNEHQKGIYIYTLSDAIGRDHKILADVTTASGFEMKTIEKCFGEAQADMLYETSDAAVAGLGLSSAMKHGIFLEHLERNLLLERRARQRAPKFTSAPKA